VRNEGQRALPRALGGAALLLLTLAVAVRPLLSGLSGGPANNAFIGGLALLAAFFWLARLLLEREVQISAAGVIPFAAFLAFAALSIGTTDHRYPALLGFFDWFVYFVLFVTVASAAREETVRRVLVAALVASAAVVIANGVHQRLWGLETLRRIIEQNPGTVLHTLRLPEQAIGDLTARTHERVFSTFVLPNALAGYLALLLPLGAGVLIGLAGAGGRRRRWPSILALAVWLIAAVLCLYFTRSKGGTVAAAAGLVAFAVLLARAWLCRHWKLVAPACIVAALALGVAGAAYATRSARTGSDSLGVRLGYWRGAWGIIAHHPLLGVGFDNFGNYYTRYKPREARETLRAHNDYLQLWSELGIGGLAAFLCLWAAFFRRAVPRGKPEKGTGTFSRQDSRESAEDHHGRKCTCPLFRSTSWIGIAAGAFTFLLVSVGFGPFWVASSPARTWMLTALFFVIWIVVFVVVERAKLDWPLLKAGAIAGVIAVLVHCLADFDLYEHGIPFTLFVIAGVALAACPNRVWHAPVGPRTQLIGIVALVVFFAAIFGFVSPRIVATDRSLQLGHAYAAEAFPPGGGLEQKMFESALTAYEAATRSCPQADAAWVGIGDLAASALLHYGFSDRELLEQANVAYQRALTLNPSSAALHYRLGALLLGVAQRAPRALAGIGGSARWGYASAARELPAAASQFGPAIVELRQAVLWYPSSALYHYTLGRTYVAAGLSQQATAEFREALALDEIAPEPQMKLKPEDIRAIKEALGLSLKEQEEDLPR